MNNQLSNLDASETDSLKLNLQMQQNILVLGTNSTKFHVLPGE